MDGEGSVVLDALVRVDDEVSTNRRSHSAEFVVSSGLGGEVSAKDVGGGVVHDDFDGVSHALLESVGQDGDHTGVLVDGVAGVLDKVLRVDSHREEEVAV